MALESGRGEFRRLCEAFVTQALRLPEWCNYECVKDLPEFGALSAFIQRDAATGKTGASEAGAGSEGATADASHSVWQFYLLPLLERCCEAKFDDVYAGLEQHLSASQASWKVTWQEVAPLPQFTAQSWPVELANGVTIRELTRGEREDLARMIGSMLVVEHGLVGASFAMSWWQPVPNALPDPRRTSDDDFDTVVTALRLLKPGAVWYNVRGSWPGHPAFGSHPASGVAIWGPNPGVRGASYELLEQDVQPLSDLLGSLVDVAQHKRLPLALRRFNMAYERTRPDDKLIDYWVALEALFLPDISQELSFRASLRIAYYVAGTPDEREEVFRKMRLSYDTRSGVVHGQRLKADVSEVASDTEEILRRALRAEVVNPGSLNVDRLDAAIARGQGAAQSGGAR